MVIFVFWCSLQRHMLNMCICFSLKNTSKSSTFWTLNPSTAKGKCWNTSTCIFKSCPRFSRLLQEKNYCHTTKRKNFEAKKRGGVYLPPLQFIGVSDRVWSGVSITSYFIILMYFTSSFRYLKKYHLLNWVKY